MESLASFFLDPSVVKFPSDVGYEAHTGSMRFIRDEINHNLSLEYYGYDYYGKTTKLAPTIWPHVLVTAALDTRPRLEDIEVWEGQYRCSKFSHSLGMLLLRSKLEVSFQAKRSKKMVVYLFSDRLAIFRSRGAALVLQLDTYPRNLLLITYEPLKNPYHRRITIYWEENIAGTSSVRFAKLFFRSTEESKVWESFLGATLLPRAEIEPKAKIYKNPEHENTHHYINEGDKFVLQLAEAKDQGRG
jgi:hypothetical protein